MSKSTRLLGFYCVAFPGAYFLGVFRYSTGKGRDSVLGGMFFPLFIDPMDSIMLEVEHGHFFFRVDVGRYKWGESMFSYMSCLGFEPIHVVW